MPLLPRTPPRPDLWVQTSWSTLARASTGSRKEADSAWNDLVSLYRAPLLARIRRLLAKRWGRPAPSEDVEEYLQAFWVACAEKGWIGRADQERGRFRAFVQVALKRFIRDEVERAHAAKRHPGYDPASLNEAMDAGIEPAAAEEDAAAFDGEWVQVATDRAIAKADAEHRHDGLVIRDLIRTDGKGSPDLAAILGVLERMLPVIKSRARKNLLKHFTAELAATVCDPADFEAEWKALAPYLP